MLTLQIRKTAESFAIYMMKDKVYKHIAWDGFGIEINEKAIDIIQSSVNILLEQFNKEDIKDGKENHMA